MSEGGMLYLIMVVAAFLIFTATLMWAMIETSSHEQDRRRVTGGHAPLHHHG